MGITEKLHHSSDSTRITLFKEGLFYKCYNQDAMLFTKLVKPYRVSVKYIKSVGAEILSIGFPASEVSKGNLTYEGATSSNTNPSNVQGICPIGWHIPRDAELAELVDYVVEQGYPNEWDNPNGEFTP